MKKTYTKAVSATLASALAVGMVPAMALADDDVQLELQTLVGKDAFDAGTIVAVDATGAAVDMKDLSDHVAKFSYQQGVAQYVAPTAIDLNIEGVADVPVDGEKVVATYYVACEAAEADFTVNWPEIGFVGPMKKVADADGDGNFAEHITEVGTYIVTINAESGDYAGGKVYYKFEIAYPTVEGATLYQDNPGNPYDFSDTVFNYTGANIMGDIDVVLNGKELKDTDCDVLFFADNGSGSYLTATEGLQSITTKGNYVAKVTGKGTYSGVTYIPFTVQAADLANENLYVDAIAAGTSAVEPTVDSIKGETLTALTVDSDDYTFKNKTAADKITTYSAPGAYTYVLKVDSVNADAEIKANVTGEKEIAVEVVSNLIGAANVYYDGKAISGLDNDTDTEGIQILGGILDNVNTKLFDASLLQVKDGSKDVAFEISVFDGNGKPATVADINTPGAWKVLVKADAEKSGYAYGGTTEFFVNYSAGTVASSGVAFLRDGSIISGTYHMDYTGENLLEEITTSVKTQGGKALVAGTDYKVVVTKDAVKVDEIVNAGTYEVAVQSDAYSIDESITVVVDPIKLLNPTITNAIDMTDDNAVNKVNFPYTGKAIVPVVKYLADDKDNTDPKDDVYKEIPADVFDFGFKCGTVKSSEMVKEGVYDITLTLKSGNYVFAGDKTTYTFEDYEVIDEWLYVDVPSTAWFADEVRLVTELKYMGGYYGGKNFGPYDSALRQDVAVVIGRMAGVAADLDDEGSTSNIGGFESPFSDVVAGAYYARSVQWINKSGIMTGYSTSDEFGVNDEITRQDLAVALYRYAQKYQRGFEAPADVAGALAAYADGAEVSGYAKAAVAWAVEQGIMGVNTTALNPADDITRAELAAMTTRLQPKAL